MYKLIIQDDEGKTTVVPLIRDELTIGRQEGNTIRLTERNVSRKHAKLLRAQEEIVIEDLDSYNGVRVNGSRIQGRAEIKESDRVQIGDYLIEVKAETPNTEAETREIAVLTEKDVPSVVPTAASDAATAPATMPVATPPPANGVSNGAAGPSLSAEATAAIVAPSEHEHGRLVILSSSMAGREFELDKPAMVIGRTEENDIWVNHRSISRHHAKIVNEQGSYAIVDLQSANGVRVNGEEYGKVELRTRDVVDLGHVRFRFVAPGEDFVFGRDAQPVDIATEGQSAKVLWAIVALLVVGVAAFLIISNSGGNKKATTDSPNNATGPDVELLQPKDPPPPQPVIYDAASVDPPPDDDQALSDYLEQAVAARKLDQWAAMGQAANKALALDPGNAKAKEYAEQAASEGNNSKLYESFQRALGMGGSEKFEQTAATFARIDPTSVYKVKGQADHDKVKGTYLKYQVQTAQKAARKNKCSEIEKMATRAIPEWPEVAEALLQVKCKESSGTKPINPTIKPPVVPPANTPSYEELIAQATAAIKDTQFGKGLRLCGQALEKKPGDQKATMTCVIASCNLKKSALAKKYLRRLNSASRRAGVKQICMRLGVEGFEGSP